MGAGLRNLEGDVDKDVWIASRAQEDADAEDMEIARLLEQLEGLDEEQVSKRFSALCHRVCSS